MLDTATYDRLVTVRRALRAGGFASYADVGCETGTVTPYHLTCGNRAGPVLISFNWLDAPTAQAQAVTLRRIGYLPAMLFNRVLDGALELARLTREDVYLTHASHLLPRARSAPLPQSVIDASFDLVTRHEIADRPVTALGHVAAAACARFGISHRVVPHPSARGITRDAKARAIAEALAP